ncbi:hypothetical protein C8039_12255 [Halogeometricum sp. wsp3]|nr:hypothetical protein C8039_12255 [Halogeometricum sp. wsp3]
MRLERVTLDSDPERVVTLNPSAAQTMWELGASDEVVGSCRSTGQLRHHLPMVNRCVLNIRGKRTG